MSVSPHYIHPFSVFTYRNQNILIDGQSLSTRKIKKSDFNILFKILNKNKEDLTLSEFKILKDKQLLRKPQKSSNNISIPPLTHITLFISQKCNLKCTYCYGNKGEYGEEGFMNKQTAFKSIDLLIKLSKNSKDLGISYFGGEPLLNFPLIRSITRYAKLKGKEYGKNFEFGITTNGTLITDEIIEFFKKNDIIPVISFDGPQEIQDKYRLFKNGKGTYNFTLSKIKKLLKDIPNSICRSTIMNSSDYSKVENHLKKIGFKYIQLTVASPSILNENDIINRNIPDLNNYLEIQIDNLLKLIKSKNSLEITNYKYSGHGWHILRIIEQFMNNQKRYFMCGAGRSGIAINAKGSIFLCHRFVGIEQFNIGNVHTEELNRFEFQKSPTKTNEKCIKCFAKNICGGGCYHDNFGINGAIDHPANDMCNFMQYLTKLSAAVFLLLDQTDIEFLINEQIICKKTCMFDIFN